MYGNYYGGYPMYGNALPDQLAQFKQPYQQMQIPTPQQQPQNNSGIPWVQGEAGAKAHLVAPGQSVMLMDSETMRFYIKSADASGVPMPLRVFEYHEVTGGQPQIMPPMSEQAQNVPQIDMSRYITREELEEKLAQLIPNQPKRTKKEDVVNE